tara:strand:- start:1636 stop:2895 length:1260 start_codon:yes stop_codon:yes gene_type:complete
MIRPMYQPISKIAHAYNKSFYGNAGSVGLPFKTPETEFVIRSAVVEKMIHFIDQKFNQYDNICFIQLGFGSGHLIRDLLTHYHGNASFKVIGIDYTDTKVNQLQRDFQSFHFENMNVETESDVIAFVKNYNNDVKARNVFTFIMMLELVDDLTTTFYKNIAGKLHELYGKEESNVRPLFTYNSQEQLLSLMGFDVKDRPYTTSSHLNWNKISFKNCQIDDQLPLPKLYQSGLNDTFWMSYHLKLPIIIESLSKISTDQLLMVIDYGKNSTKNTPPVRVYPIAVNSSENNFFSTFPKYLLFYCIAKSINDNDLFTLFLSFLSLLAFQNFLDPFKDSWTSGQVPYGDASFKAKPLFCQYGRQQLTANTNSDQVISNLTEFGYDCSSNEFSTSFNVQHDILSGGHYFFIEAHKNGTLVSQTE